MIEIDIYEMLKILSLLYCINITRIDMVNMSERPHLDDNVKYACHPEVTSWSYFLNSE